MERMDSVSIVSIINIMIEMTLRNAQLTHMHPFGYIGPRYSGYDCYARLC